MNKLNVILIYIYQRELIFMYEDNYNEILEDLMEDEFWDEFDENELLEIIKFAIED